MAVNANHRDRFPFRLEWNDSFSPESIHIVGESIALGDIGIRKKERPVVRPLILPIGYLKSSQPFAL
jgi:hypothetical protein